MSEASILKEVEEVLEIIKDSNEEANEYQDESEFNRGMAFAYRCVLNLFKEFGIGERVE